LLAKERLAEWATRPTLVRVTDVDRITQLTRRALDEFDSGQSVSAIVRRAHRIAVLRHDYAAQV